MSLHAKDVINCCNTTSKRLQNQRDMRHAEGASCRNSVAGSPKKIVEKSSNIAQKAAAEAKAASEAQNIAGQQAARQVLKIILLHIPSLKEIFFRDINSRSRDTEILYFNLNSVQRARVRLIYYTLCIFIYVYFIHILIYFRIFLFIR